MGEMVEFASNGTSAQGYLAVPPGGSGPGLLLIQEYWGLVQHIRDLADRFAAAGFVTLAPDLFHGVTADEPDEAMRLMMGMAMDRAGRDMAGAAAFLAARDDTTGDGIGAVGFCLGGSLALWSATLSEDLQVAVAFYPAVPWQRMEPSWGPYGGKVAMIHTSESDGGPEADGIRTARDGIEAAGGIVQVFGYPGTHHAFFNDTRPETHDPQAAELAWTRTVGLLRERLSPG